MAYGDGNEQIRKRAWERYISPQIQRGVSVIELAIKPLMKEMEAEGFKPNRPRQFCTALQKKAFLRENNLVLDHVDGPPSGTSTTVVLHFRHVGSGAGAAPVAPGESAAQRASRLTERLRGLMKEEIAEHGGAEGYMRWVRSDSETDESADANADVAAA